MKRSLFSRMRGEDGSAMTEFVITLPIFIMIFSGMGMLYRYNHEGLIARMNVNQILVANATAPNNIPGFIPLAGAAFSINGFGDVVLNGSGALGMYWDSYIKAGAAEAIIPGQAIANPASPPRNDIQQITGMSGLAASDSFTNMLMNDRAYPYWDTGGWANILASIVSTVAVSPSLAAGIRYMPVQAQQSHNFSHGWAGSETYDPGQLSLAAPTAAHWRLAPVAAARIAANNVEPYKECILEFNYDLCTDGNPSASTTQMNNINAAAQACAAQSDIWQGCMDSCAADPSVLVWPVTSCDQYCNGSRPDDDCANVGDDLGVATPWGCPGANCATP